MSSQCLDLWLCLPQDAPSLSLGHVPKPEKAPPGVSPCRGVLKAVSAEQPRLLEESHLIPLAGGGALKKPCARHNTLFWGSTFPTTSLSHSVPIPDVLLFLFGTSLLFHVQL